MGIDHLPSEFAIDGVDALYVHVPFCDSKCHYCDFYSVAGHLDQVDAFLEAMRVEAALWRCATRNASSDPALRGGGGGKRKISPSTIFIGGGTPTLLAPEKLRRLLTLIREAIDPSRLVEFTVEANPNTFDSDRAAVLREGGINRVSFGAQSFLASELRTLQRNHDPESVARAFETARQADIDNLNIDLIFGIPGQTLETWEYSLTHALELRPQHMSCYSLIYEPGTAMTTRMKRSDFSPIAEDLELAMFEHVYARMRAAGFRRYEVSNYAFPGRECRHNIHYWKGSQWLAWGPAAAGHLAGEGGRWRWKNVASLKHYLESLLSATGQPTLPLTQVEHLSPRAWAGEVAAFWLRLSEGLDYADFQARTGIDGRPVLERALQKYVELDLVELLPTCVRLTEKAVAVSNRIFADALAAFEECTSVP
ncbi:MAG: radical SAM family heme chaperone HemW [Phycisphaerales bacterium]|nr:radical SAM family heme chaperone HemW [Phycisphaerales bacterium]